GAVHGLESQFAEVAQPRDHLRQDFRIDVTDRGLPVILEARAQEVLFKRDLPNHSFLVRFRRAPCTVVWTYCTSPRNRRLAHGPARFQRPKPNSGDRAGGIAPARAGEPGVPLESRAYCATRPSPALDGAAHRP